MNCKSCGCGESVKNGRVRSKQRYRCKGCGLNFVAGDARVKPDGAVKRAFAVLLYGMGKSSLGFIARRFGNHAAGGAEMAPPGRDPGGRAGGVGRDSGNGV
jgi:transposase-like protein